MGNNNIKLIVGIPAYNAYAKPNFRLCLEDNKLVLNELIDSGDIGETSDVLVACGGKTPDSVQRTLQIVQDNGALGFLRKSETCGRSRIEVVTKAFNELKADCVIICDDDNHQKAENIPNYLSALRSGADLVIGSRSFMNMATHPVPQWFSEEVANLFVNFKLKLPSSKGRVLFPDYLSGGQAFSKNGWSIFLNAINGKELPKDPLTDTFIPAVFKNNGLNISVINILAPYEARYFRDGFSLTKLKLRFNVFTASLNGLRIADSIDNKKGSR